MEQELALVKTEDLELLARRSLAADSARAKVAVSRLVAEILSRLDASVPVRSAAQALGALAPILRLVYGWGREPDFQRMARAVTSYAEGEPTETPTGAVNLALINTTPEQLAALAKAKFDRDEQPDTSATECDGQGAGPSVVRPEQPPAATHGPPIPKKEAPKPPLEGQSAQVAPAGHPLVTEKPQQPSDWFERIAHPAPLAQTSLDSFQRPPGWHEHRQANREKYR